MKLQTGEIGELIKEQIRNYEGQIESNDVGTVISVGDGIAAVYGLKNAMLGELLLFPKGIYGMVMNLNADDVGAIILGSDLEIKEGDTVKRTSRMVEVPVGTVDPSDFPKRARNRSGSPANIAALSARSIIASPASLSATLAGRAMVSLPAGCTCPKAGFPKNRRTAANTTLSRTISSFKQNCK